MAIFVTRDEHDRFSFDWELAFNMATPTEQKELKKSKPLEKINLMIKYGTYNGYLAITDDDAEKYEEELEDQRNWSDLPIYDYKDFYLPVSKRRKVV